MAKKRGQNEGSIYRTSDGRWAAAFTTGYFNGKQRRKVLYAKTREDVARKLTTALRERDQGLAPTNDKLALGTFLEQWLEGSVKGSTRPRTYQSYCQLVRLHILPVLGNERLTKLSVQRVNTFLAAKRQTGLSPRTVQYLRAVLRRALNMALKWGLVARNVAALADTPKIERHAISALDSEQARRLLAAAAGHRLEALFSVALAVGLRIGEALALEWADVDLKARTLTVSKQLQRIGGKLVVTHPKSHSGRRTIPLPSCAVEALKDHRLRQELQDRPLAGERWQESSFVFTTTIGTPLEPRNATKQFQELLKRAGLRPMRFHDLRHTCATLLLAQNVHPRVVMEILGHSQISLTMNTYSHVVPRVMAEAAEKMDEALGRSEIAAGVR